MQDKDFLISSVKCLIDAKGQLKIDTREQLQKVNCTAIQVYCKLALSYLLKQDTGFDVMEITANISNVIKLITDILVDDSFTETDSETKDFINQLMLVALTKLCIVTGKYYSSEHEFNFNIQLTKTYNYIIDVCIDNDYYFGMTEEDIREGE